jgi:hypothetical protein
MLMSLPEFCHSVRTPAALVLSVKTDVIGFCGKLLVAGVKCVSIMADAIPLLVNNKWAFIVMMGRLIQQPEVGQIIRSCWYHKTAG